MSEKTNKSGLMMTNHCRSTGSPRGVALRLVTCALVLAAVAGCRSEPGLQPFSSDGCSLFPDRSLISEEDWCSCCFEHDIVYWLGGTRVEREQADAALRDCVAEKTGNRAFGQLMYEGVRVGGSPYFVTWYRWGYGWPFSRKYEPLSDVERQHAARLLREYRAGNPEPVCAAADSQGARLSESAAAYWLAALGDTNRPR